MTIISMTSSQFIWMDGKLVPWNDATIHVTKIATAGVSLVYEGIRAYWNNDIHALYVFQLDAHVARLVQSIRLSRMQNAMSGAEIKQGILDLLRSQKFTQDVYIRPFAYVESETFGDMPSDPPHIVISASPNPSRLKQGKVAHVCVSSWSRITDNVMPPRVKASSNYLNSRYASEEAKRNGYDNAIILQPNGKVAEAPGACVMLVRDGKVITPSITSGVLESITRDTMIQLCREVLKLEVVERDVDRTELYVANEAFLCGTGAEVVPLLSIDRFTVGDGTVGAITRSIENTYSDVARGVDNRYSEWRTRV